ncbi:MAG: bifunctional diaminohydroxyphosphoribosylaminopyrimidine deaminase/5-amino-6-(5-phosphoribosylamino)uracil reductase RibD [Candidatus Omnitrophica bacterium]|nr:bifunctional diaminohydroxyphosphoribosylaminopyrimidine deaminase/5-amino-6-(5-phosphoribosylamino)uracil reductase RibD [Candidatus Omnitrophota bacterium]MCM8816634.1 bifunctional diaminohydroxyphosphoribosylaminopyrimidine deaminase/5-amino-6-(5-phosphoribosylamino)uracil reductase RibD [Candidatus Omnitrophota bacterium]
MNHSRDEFFLKKCLFLAKKGLGLVSPNPMVGAIVVKGNHVVGHGWHHAYGLPHAEVEAIKMAGIKAKDATLYVNLEPCCHYGKTPPCTDLIIKTGIKKVVFCTIDPNPFVAGKSVDILKQNGIEVRYGLLEDDAKKLNEAYFIHTELKRPYITLKWAMSIDGKIADKDGKSKWITSQDTRAFLKKLRFEYDAILVGSKTVLKDDPLLDFCIPHGLKKRLIDKKRFFKIILDSNLSVSPDAKVFSNKLHKVIIFRAKENFEDKKQFPENVKIVEVDRECENGLLNVKDILKFLYSEGIGKIFVEGGTRVLTTFYNFGLYDSIFVFIGGKIIGGPAVYPPLEGRLLPLDKESGLVLEETKRFENDILMIFKNVYRNN